MIVTCRDCKRKLEVEDAQAARGVVCPRCERRITAKVRSRDIESAEVEEADSFSVTEAPSVGETRAGRKAFLDDLDRHGNEEIERKQRDREMHLRETMMSGTTAIGAGIGLLLGIGVSAIIWSRGYVLLPRGWMMFISLGLFIGTGIGAGLSALSIYLDRRRNATGKPKKKKRRSR
jgi:DNA-directed RNA polymerase subunit RPC12/RpoP